MTNKRIILPNLFTMANLCCGFIALVKIHEGAFVSAAWLIILAAFLDAFDGKVARFTKGYSSFGLEFDSLADLVSCGLAPAFLVYALYLHHWGTIGVIISFLFVLAAAFRLARFNVMTSDVESKEQFYGMPVPLAAITVATYVIFLYNLWGTLRFGPVLFLFVILLSALMVSTIRYETFPKLTFHDSRENNVKFAVLLGMTLVVAFNPGKAMFPFALGLVLHGIFRGVYRYFSEPDDEEVIDATVTDESI